MQRLAVIKGNAVTGGVVAIKGFGVIRHGLSTTMARKSFTLV